MAGNSVYNFNSVSSAKSCIVQCCFSASNVLCHYVILWQLG